MMGFLKSWKSFIVDLERYIGCYVEHYVGLYVGCYVGRYVGRNLERSGKQQQSLLFTVQQRHVE